MNSVKVPMYEYNTDGSIKPNTIFHRSWDKLHSRCIEYPFAASKVEADEKILDIGTAKGDKAWCDWLESLPLEVHATDYDKTEYPFKNVTFYQGDVRKLPYEDNTFDKILAVSVIEHIGLEDAQVNHQDKPNIDEEGDINAVRELIRILKPGGSLVMTFPIAKQEFIFAESARVYSIDRVSIFNSFAKPLSLEYYEYQYLREKQLYSEYPKLETKSKKGFLKTLLDSKKTDDSKEVTDRTINFIPELPGIVTWRKLPYEYDFINAKQDGHIDGVLCGVWTK
jgi:ubiquinone/menaquinone biosynthesis C-methylase UbiE